MSLTVSIIIATAGRGASLDRTLSSLRQLRYPHFEVLVVLGPSSDHSHDIVAGYAHAIRCYTTDRLNLSAARNIGLAQARGDIVAFIDDDAIPEPDWLNNLLSGYDTPDVAQVGGFIRDNRGIGFQCRYVAVDRFGDSWGYEAMPADLDRNRFLALTGTNFSARRDVLMQIGGFDEEFAYFLDETDVTVRLIDQGLISRIVPQAEIHHKFEPSHLRTAARVPRSMYPTARSKAYFCCVHGTKQHDLGRVLEHLAEFARKERIAKQALFQRGHADKATVDRLIEEMECGLRDGVRDALSQSKPQLLAANLIAAAQGAVFKPFPLPRLTERLRLCFLSQDYPPIGIGGIGQWIREMATGLAARGHEVTVLCRSETDYPYIDFIEGVWVHRITGKGEITAELSQEVIPLSLLSYSAALEAEVRRIQPRRQFDLICGPLFDLEPLVALRKSGIPTVISLHTTYRLALPFKPDWADDEWFRKSHVDKVINMERVLLDSAPFLEANTHALVADLERAYGVQITEQRLEVIPHGIKDLSLGVSPFDKAPGTTRLLFVGRLELRKGADLLLDALPVLLDRHPDLVVDIVGDDRLEINGATLRARFERAARNDHRSRVTFHGVVARDELLRHYATCDLLVAPSRYESFGLVFVEAMVFTKPVVGIAVGGVSEVVTDEMNGLLIPDDNVEALTKQVSRLVEDPTLRAKLGENGRRTYETRFRSDKMLDDAEAYYRRIVSSTNTQGAQINA